MRVQVHQRALLARGGVSYDENNWYAPYVEQARDLSELGSADVVMVGDSLTMYGLWQEFFPNVVIANRGIGSDVSEGVLSRLDTVVGLRPSKVFLMIGTNDVSRGYDEADIVANMEAILETLESELPDAQIYLESVLPRLAKNADAIESLNVEYRRLADGYANVTYVDLYPLYCDENGVPVSELFASDGYHMSGSGYALWVEQIREFV